jgi:hypothetical protein
VKTASDWADDVKTRSILTRGVKLHQGQDEPTDLPVLWHCMDASREAEGAMAEGIDPDSCAGNGAMSW